MDTEGVARFQPVLNEGMYEVSLPDESPAKLFEEDQDPIIQVRVKHANREALVLLDTSKTKRMGRFEFKSGNSGWVQLETGNTKGIVIADAVRFKMLRAVEDNKGLR